MATQAKSPPRASTADPAAGPPGGPAAFHRSSVVWRFVDREWTPFIALLLMPAVVCFVLGHPARAAFFARLALYLGFVKWIGWVALARPSDHPRAVLVFAAELVLGVTGVVLWFYLRNFVTWLTGASYSLVELRVLTWLVAVTQCAGAIALCVHFVRARQPIDWRAWLARACIYGPFALTLTLALWSVSREVHVPSQDGWFHSFIARVYLNDGLFFRHFNGGDTIFYVSGFGAMNAVSAAASGLTVVQTHNLQHILWIITGFYLVTTVVAAWSGRTLRLLHAVPPIFLAAYPAHNLPPDLYWTHTPQQTASVLLVAIPLLSLILPSSSRLAFYGAIAAQAALSVVVLALTPVATFFLPPAAAAALIINIVRARKAFGDGIARVVAVQGMFVLLAAVLVLGCDRYYSQKILNPRASYMGGSHFGGDAPVSRHLFTFAPGAGLAYLAKIEPLGLLPDIEEDPESLGDGRFLPWLAAALTLAALALAVAQRNTERSTARRLAILAALGMTTALAVKLAAVFVSGSIINASPDLLLLKVYLVFLVRRIELGLLFLTVTSAGVALALSPGTRNERVFSGAMGVVMGIALAIWWRPAELAARAVLLTPQNLGVSGRITRDDIELARWAEQNIPRSQGLIGLTSIPFMASLGTKLLFPDGSSQALPLYSRQYNFTFQIFDPGRPFGYDDYMARVVNYFDADWLFQNGIRFFHVPRITPIESLRRAVDLGLLQPVMLTPSSGIYAVRPLTWRPETMPGPARWVASHDIVWLPDGSGHARGSDPYVEYALDRPTFVHAIRFRYSLANSTRSRPDPQVFWKAPGQNFVEHERTMHLWVPTVETDQTFTVLVHDTIDRFRVDPDNEPCEFRIGQIELLVRPAETAAAAAPARKPARPRVPARVR